MYAVDKAVAVRAFMTIPEVRIRGAWTAIQQQSFLSTAPVALHPLRPAVGEDGVGEASGAEATRACLTLRHPLVENFRIWFGNITFSATRSTPHRPLHPRFFQRIRQHRHRVVVVVLVDGASEGEDGGGSPRYILDCFRETIARHVVSESIAAATGDGVSLSDADLSFGSREGRDERVEEAAEYFRLLSKRQKYMLLFHP